MPPLFDDRGYLDILWAQAEYRFIPSYRYSLSGFAGTALEQETHRGRIPAQKVGTDNLGIEARAKLSAWELGLKALRISSNTGYRALQIQGDLTWHL